MVRFEYSAWDGSNDFLPQSADNVFDQIAEYLLQHGEDAMPLLDELEKQHPELLEKLIKQGRVERDADGKFQVTPRGIKRVANRALAELFQRGRGHRQGGHESDRKGAGEPLDDETRPWRFGDSPSLIDGHETLRNAMRRNSIEGTRERTGMLRIAEDDLVVRETEAQTNCATVVLLDMSGSMSRYGKYGGAKKVALALWEMTRSRFPGDFLTVVGFHTYATALTERELFLSAPKPVSIYDSRVHLRIDLDNPPRFVPEHFTNIQAGLRFARQILRRRGEANKQIITITDGEPTAHIEGREVVLIYPPAEKTARATLAEAKSCAAEGFHMSSFALVEDYFYLGLVNFVDQMAAVTRGTAAYCDADNLGNLVIESFREGRKRRRAVR
jgi:Ca-activated chloride channel homolog